MRAVRPILTVLVALAALLASSSARADKTCRIANVTPLNFGTYDVSSTLPLDSNGLLSLECGAPVPVQIIMGRGLSGRQTPREMRARGVRLEYNLFLDAARTVMWGDGTEGTQVFTGMAQPLQTLQLPIFGRVFPRQAVAPGVYTDRIVVAVIF